MTCSYLSLHNLFELIYHSQSLHYQCRVKIIYKWKVPSFKMNPPNIYEKQNFPFQTILAVLSIVYSLQHCTIIRFSNIQQEEKLALGRTGAHVDTRTKPRAILIKLLRFRRRISHPLITPTTRSSQNPLVF